MATVPTSKPMFGEIAVMLGFVDEDQLERALAEQRARAARGGAHKLLGLVMLELGLIDNAQLIEVLKTYERLARASAG